MNDLPAMPERDAQEVKANLARQAASNPQLQNVPPQFRQFFQAYMPKTSNPGGNTMDLSGGRARPEELTALRQVGWNGQDEIPLDIANNLKQHGVVVKSLEEELDELEDQPGLDPKDLKPIPLREAPPEIKKSFQETVRKLEDANLLKPPTVYDSRKPQPPAAARPDIQNVSMEQLATSPKAAPIPAAPVAAPSPKPEEPKDQPETHEPHNPNAVCPRCAWLQRDPYPVQPTQQDIQMRLVSFGSAAQGGDGRFRKQYSLFNGTIKLWFRELTTEGHKIYMAEGDLVMQDNSGKSQLQQLYSLDRIQFRRQCCGLEKISRPGQEISVPPLDLVIEKNQGNVQAALEQLEKFVREQCYGNESIMLAAGRCWAEFENLVTALWNNQSFYSGNP